MIKPHKKDAALLNDIRKAKALPDTFHIWWLGQSGFLLKWNAHHLLLDPYLSDSLTEKYAGTDQPHLRMTERAIDPAKLDMIDVVTSSHNHTDHLDAETLRPLITANPRVQLVLPKANIVFASERLGDATPEIHGIVDAKQTVIDPFSVTGIPAAHNEIDRDGNGNCHYLGFVVRFGDFCIYHSGDTLWHDDLIPLLRDHRPIDLMLLPINGHDPERRVAGNLNGNEAATLARACAAGMVIPCHYDMFEFNTASPDEFIEACEKTGQPHKVLRCGERWTCSR